MNFGFECKKKMMINSDAWGTLKQSQFSNKSSRFAMLMLLPLIRTNVNLFESVICLVPGELWNFLEVIMLYDKCIVNAIS